MTATASDTATHAQEILSSALLVNGDRASVVRSANFVGHETLTSKGVLVGTDIDGEVSVFRDNDKLVLRASTIVDGQPEDFMRVEGTTSTIERADLDAFVELALDTLKINHG